MLLAKQQYTYVLVNVFAYVITLQIMFMLATTVVVALPQIL